MTDSSPWSFGRVAAVAAVLAVVAFWSWIFLGGPDTDPPDELADDTFPEAAQPLCAEAREQIDALPPAADTPTPEERAEVLDEANAVLRSLVGDLRALEVPDVEDDRRFVGLWLDDWATYVEDREAFADALREGEDAELLVTARGGRQITVTVDNFARVNDMEDCAVPLDA